VLDATFARPDLTTFCRLDDLGLEVVGQQPEDRPGGLSCRGTEPDRWCRDIRADAGDTYLTLGRDPLLLIPPLDVLITALPVAKPFGTASTLADHGWLFTGKNAGTHLQPPSLMARMNRLGIAIRVSRNTAPLLHLASTTPPAIFANRIGVDIGTATRWAGLAGASWNNYAAILR